MRVAIVGSTGMVGREILDVLFEREFPLTELIPVASEKSYGKSILFDEKSYKIISLKQLLDKKIDIAFFAAGAEISKIWAPKLADKGTRVIDNSSFWRMDINHKLIIPEVNGNDLSGDDFIISNPNCSTIQLLMVLAPLHKNFIVKRAVVSTYQAVSGTGKKALDQLTNEAQKIQGEMVYPHPIFQNALPQCDAFTDNGYTKEEMKLTKETKKILDSKIDVVATAVRIPVIRGHSESVNITLKNHFTLDEIRNALNNMSGVTIIDRLAKNEYPMPIYSQKKNEVFVGRIRKDFTQSNTLNLWIVADNLRKGAATNAVQIAEYLISKKLI